MSPAKSSAWEKIQALAAELASEIETLEAEISEKQSELEAMQAQYAAIGGVAKKGKGKAKAGRKPRGGAKPDEKAVIAALRKLGAKDEESAVRNDGSGLAGELGVESRILTPVLNKLHEDGTLAFSGVRRGTRWWLKA